MPLNEYGEKLDSNGYGVLLMLVVAAVRPAALRQIFPMTTASPEFRRRMCRKPLMRFLC